MTRDRRDLRTARDPAHRHLSPLALLVVSALVIAACAGGEDRATDISVETASTTSFSMDDGEAFRETAQQIFAECMAERGFDVISTPDGGSEVNPPPGQEKAASAAGETCAEEVRRLAPPRPLDADELRRFYELQIEVAACLERLGFQIPEPPSFERFAESQGGAWIPYTFLPSMNQDEWYLVNEACPQP